MKFNFNNSETAAEELNAEIERNVYLTNYQAVMLTFDQNTSKLLKVTSTTVDKAIEYMENARNEITRDTTENYWDNYDSKNKVFRRGFVSHIPHNARVGYLVDLVEDIKEADEIKKAFLPLEAGIVRMPVNPPSLVNVLNGKDIDKSIIADEMGKYQEYRKLALEGKK